MDPKNTNLNPSGTGLGSAPAVGGVDPVQAEPVVPQVPSEPAMPASGMGTVDPISSVSEEPTASEPVVSEPATTAGPFVSEEPTASEPVEVDPTTSTVSDTPSLGVEEPVAGKPSEPAVGAVDTTEIGGVTKPTI